MLTTLSVVEDQWKVLWLNDKIHGKSITLAQTANSETIQLEGIE